MSHALNTSVAPFCYSQDHPGSIAVPARGVPAWWTPEGLLCES